MTTKPEDKAPEPTAEELAAQKIAEERQAMQPAVPETVYDGEDMLTAEEREALAELDDEQEPDGAAKTIGELIDADEINAESETAPFDEENAVYKPEEDTPTDAAPAEEPAPAAEEPAVEDQPAEDDIPAPTPLAEFDLKGKQDEIAAANTEAAELLDKFNDAEISEEAFKEQQQAITDKLTDLNVEVKLHERDVEAYNADLAKHQDQLSQRYFDQVDKYFEAYPELKSDALINAFDRNVRAANANPALESMSVSERLEYAHKTFLLEPVGKDGVKPPELKTNATKVENPKTEAKKPTPPTTLATVPAADVQTTTNESPFAAIHAEKDIERQEAMVEELSQRDPAAYEQYLQGG